MFDELPVYAGSIVSSQVETVDNASQDIGKVPVLPSDYIDLAKEDAKNIIEQAERDAEAYLVEKRIEADQIAEQEISERINRAFLEFGNELWSAKSAISEVTGRALEHMIGEIGSQNALVRAVEKASMEYSSEVPLVIRANQANANRLRLVYLSRKKDRMNPPVDVVEDKSLGDDRCILTAQNGSIEISIDQQIKAIKQILAEADRETDPNITSQ